MRKRLNYANVTATLALFFAMSGGALAAKHYLISKSSQISPKVLKALKGNAGPQGIPGALGAPGREGQQGKEGKEGKEGAAPATLPSGHSESGVYGVGDVKEGYMVEGITYPLPLPGKLDEEHVSWLEKGKTSTNCPGPGKAARGHLCVYEEQGASHSAAAVDNSGGFIGSDAAGFMMFFSSTEILAYSYGNWTVTAA